MHQVAWTSVSLRSTAANRISNLLRQSSLATRNPARKTDRSYRGFCYRRLSSRTAYTEGLSNRPSSQGNLLCADQIDFACEETECMNLPVRELAAFPRCSVRTAQSTGALPNAVVPVGLCTCRRFPLGVRFGALVFELGQSRRPLLWTHR